MPWVQTYIPVSGSLGLSALTAAAPLAVIFICLALLRMKAHKASLLAVATALVLAVTIWGMPAGLAGLATLQGAAFGVFPVFYIVVATIFLYNITVESGQFEILRASLASVTADRRLQALLIAFCFGALIEGSAGFGTPVAIAGATLVGLGFRPYYAASVCLLANTAPVAFGAIGIPVVALAGVMGYGDAGMMKLSAMIARQLPFISFFIPLYVIVIMAGWKKSLEVLPAILVCGTTFAATQWAAATYLGPYLPDIIASLASIVALVLLLRVWHPRTIWTFDHEPDFAEKEQHNYSSKEVFRAWAPYLALTVMVLLWGIPSLKHGLDHGTLEFRIPGLDRGIVKNISRPDEGMGKTARINTELDKAMALLSASAPQATELLSQLQQLKARENALFAIEQSMAGNDRLLTADRLRAFAEIDNRASVLKKSAARSVPAGSALANELMVLQLTLNDQLPVRIPAVFKLNTLSAAGTSIIIAALLSALICGIGGTSLFRIVGKTLYDLRYPAVTIGAVVGLAYLMNASGMTTSLGLVFTKAGHIFPFISPFLGWLGVFLTGSDTSSNVLFGGLQKATAEQLGINAVLAGAANTSGGVMGKMISPQSIAVATAATGLVGEEGNLFRFTLKHSLFLTTIVGIIVYLEAYYFPWMIP